MKHYKKLGLLIIIAFFLAFSSSLFSQTGHWEKLNPPHNPRYRAVHGMAPIGKHKILLFGGGNNDSIFNDTWLYDLDKNDWEAINCLNPPSPRYGFSMCQISDNKVLLFGGLATGAFADYNDLWLFDLDSMDWKELKPKGWNDNHYPPPTYLSAMAKLSETSVIIYGGEVDDTTKPDRLYSNETWIYHIDKNEWELSLGLCAGATSNHNLIELDSNVVLLVGGINGILLNYYIFDDKMNNWLRIKDLKSNLDCYYIAGSASANLTRGIALLFGGKTAASSSDATWYDSTWVFNYFSKSWSKLNLNPHPSDRLRGRMARIDSNKAILFGGISKTNKHPDDTWMFVLDSIPSDVQDEQNQSELKLSPNPATDILEISLSQPSEGWQPSEGYHIAIFNVFGMKIPPRLTSSATPQEGNLRLDVSGLSPGMYFIRVGEKVGKFVKM